MPNKLTALALFLFACAPYNPTRTLQIQIDSLTYSEASEITPAIYEAVDWLDDCKLLKDGYPELHKEFRKAITKPIKVGPCLSWYQLPCGEYDLSTKAIRINTRPSKHHSKMPGCNTVDTVAHEMLHMIGEMDEELVEKIVWKCVR